MAKLKNELPLNRPFYLKLKLDKRFGTFGIWYSSKDEEGTYTRLFKITADQADEMHADGWPIEEFNGMGVK